MAVTVLLRLARLCGREDFATRAVEAIRAHGEIMERHPSACGQMLIAFDFFLGPVQEIVVVGPAQSPDTQATLATIHQSFRPHQVVVFHDPAWGEPPIDLIPLLKDRPAVNGQVTTYICEKWVCQAPRIGPLSREQLDQAAT